MALATRGRPKCGFSINLLKRLTMSTIDLEVQGMSGNACIKHVTQTLRALAGVIDVAVDLHAGHVRVIGEFPQGSDALTLALCAAGYPARLVGVADSITPSALWCQQATSFSATSR